MQIMTSVNIMSPVLEKRLRIRARVPQDAPDRDAVGKSCLGGVYIPRRGRITNSLASAMRTEVGLYHSPKGHHVYSWVLLPSL